MRYAGIIKNDFAAAPGICVSFWTQFCPHHCPGCQNPETNRETRMPSPFAKSNE